MRIQVHDSAPAILVVTSSQFDEVLASAEKEARKAGRLNLVTLESDVGDTLSFVIGGEESVAGFTYALRQTPYLASQGSDEKDEPVLSAFLGLQHHTEFPRSRVVPASDVLRAAREFLTTGALPQAIRWTEI